MSAQQNKNTLKQFQTALECRLAGKDAELAPFLHNDATWHFPLSTAGAASSNLHEGKNAVLGMFESETALFYQPETIRFHYHAFTAEDDRVHMHYSLTAKTVAGEDYQNDYQSLFRFESGLIREVWEYFDTAWLYQQFNQA